MQGKNQRESLIFQPTLPARGATMYANGILAFDIISTHAPRTGSDETINRNRELQGNFNPRSPHGERRRGNRFLKMWGNFNPRSPHGERRANLCYDEYRRKDFNPRSPHGERHRSCPRERLSCQDFNPRSPHGERQKYPMSTFRKVPISTHAPRTGSDRILQEDAGQL